MKFNLPYPKSRPLLRAIFGLVVTMLVVTFAVVAIRLVGIGKTGRDQASSLPDVVVIVIDTLRPDHLGFHRSSLDIAPFLAKLARESVVFNRAFSTSSWTAPATASLFTGLYPTRHGVVDGFFAHRDRTRQIEQHGKVTIHLNRMPRNVRTMPEVFRSGGYATYGVAANVNIGDEMGFDRGFDHFERLHGGRSGESASAELMLEKLTSWKPLIRESSPNFIYLHFNDPHAPYNQRAPWYSAKEAEIEDLKSAYDSEISYLDRTLETMFSRFGWGENEILVVISDHGEEFMEHGNLRHEFTLYRELVQILAMVRAPQQGVQSREITENVSIVDILLTLVELAGLRSADESDGTSLLPMLQRSEAEAELEAFLDERTLFGHRVSRTEPKEHLWTAIKGEWHFIDRSGLQELYNFVGDPAETEKIHRPDVTAELAEHLEAFKKQTARKGEAMEVEIDRDELERLRALGYVK